MACLIKCAFFIANYPMKGGENVGKSGESL
jgi:hypothetical protein